MWRPRIEVPDAELFLSLLPSSTSNFDEEKLVDKILIIGSKKVYMSD